MKTMKDFAAQQLSKKQMNQVRGGELPDCFISHDGKDAHIIYVMREDLDATRAAAEEAGWDIVC